jgi:LacI family transcriptional regulator
MRNGWPGGVTKRHPVFVFASKQKLSPGRYCIMLWPISMPHCRNKARRIAVIGAPVLQSQSLFNAALIRHASKGGNWKFVFSSEVSVQTLRFLRRFECDGALIRIISPAIARESKKLSFPVVNFSSWLADPKVPTVRCDNVMMGRLAADHLLKKGFRRFGIVLSKGGWFTHPRHQSFLETVKAAGFGANAHTFHLHSHPADAADLKRFCQWIRGLQAPVGLFLTNDDPDAPALLDACRAAGRRVPQDVAVITSHGHPQICLACRPPLTYVDQNEEGVAKHAAEYLDRLMSGATAEVKTIVVPSGGVVPLESTDTVAVDDREVAQAVEFIRGRIAEPVNIKDLAQNFSIARRTLERRFRSAMGISLHDFQVRERIERARDLLSATPPLAIAEVARRCGFSSAARLNMVFRQQAGLLPSAWRSRSARG